MMESIKICRFKTFLEQYFDNNNKNGLLTYFSTFRELQYVYNLNLRIKVFTIRAI